MDKAVKIAALLAKKQEMDAVGDATLNMGVGSNARYKWVCEALALLLQAELDRRPL